MRAALVALAFVATAAQAAPKPVPVPETHYSYLFIIASHDSAGAGLQERTFKTLQECQDEVAQLSALRFGVEVPISSGSDSMRLGMYLARDCEQKTSE